MPQPPHRTETTSAASSCWPKPPDLLSDRIGPHAELAFARALAAGELVAEPVLDNEWARIAELTEQYLDLPLGMADASLVALAERHDATEIASLDHRHLGVVRPRHAPSFTLLP
jgi:predicted nucleic acid-binding protein